jgi:LPS-assembly lipoprotein
VFDSRNTSNFVPVTRRTLAMRLAHLGLLGVVSAGLLGCGFKLRGNQSYVFSRMAITPSPGGAIAAQLRSELGRNTQVIAADAPLTQAQVVLRVSSEQREKVVVGVNTSGQVREMQLRIRVRFSLSTPKGKDIVVDDEILQQRDFSFNESAALAKEAEEALLYRDMQSDLVQQLMRRMAAIKPEQLD